MSECTNKKFEDMLNAYELGMLKGEDEHEFELHLYECASCFERAQHFEKAASHIRHNPNIHEAIGEIAGRQTEAGQIESPVTKRAISLSRLWKSVIPTTVAIIVLAILIFKPWDIQIQPSKEALAAENLLAIMYFNNVSDTDDPQNLGEISANLLISDLSESSFMRIVSNQRLYDILKQMNKEGQKTFDKDNALAIARKAGAKWMLTGDILQEEPELILTSVLIEVSSGNILSSQKITGETGDDLFFVIDKLSVEVKNELPLPNDALLEPDRPVAEVTTNSQDAYRHYLDGLDLMAKYYYKEAAQSFELALENDSTFAMVYYYLARLKDRSFITEAVKYSAKATQKEKLYIQSLQVSISGNTDSAMAILNQISEQYPDEKDAYFLTGQYKFYQFRQNEAVPYFHKSIEIDPYYKVAYNFLAHSYDELDNLDSSLWAINKYIELAPDEANPYNTRGHLYALNGQLDQAVNSYIKSLEMKPDFLGSLANLCYMYLFKRDYYKADSCARHLGNSESKSYKVFYRYYLALIELDQGKYSKALEILDQCLLENEKEPRLQIEDRVRKLKAHIYEETGSPQKAAVEIRKVMDLYKDKKQGAIYYALKLRALRLENNFGEAVEVLENYGSELDSTDRNARRFYLFDVGTLSFYQGDMDRVINAMEEFLSDEGANRCFDAHYLLALASLEKDNLAGAVKELETQIDMYDYWRLVAGSWNVKMHYHLAIAYERSNWFEKAIEQYEMFLNIWKNADPGIAEIEDAKIRLARLKSNI